MLVKNLLKSRVCARNDNRTIVLDMLTYEMNKKIVVAGEAVLISGTKCSDTRAC